MRTYQAGKDPVEAWGGETRAWVFDLLENPEYRRRLEALAALDLTRRPGCEPCLRALVIDDWDYESLHHLGWCESCRAASLALGIDTTAATTVGSGYGKRALVVVLVAGVAIAAPLAGSHLLNRGDDDRGGVAQQTTPSTTPGTTPSTTPGTTPSTTPGTTPSTTPSTTPTTTTPVTTTPVEPVPRSRPTVSVKGRGERALPETT